MAYDIDTVVDSKRGCGWRSSGGLYLMGGSTMAPCGRFPIRLDRCPTCDHGVKPGRGWTWIDIDPFKAANPCSSAPPGMMMRGGCRFCPFADDAPEGGLQGRVGLLWIGEVFYKTPADFLREGAQQGLSRRIAAIPHGFELGKTWVCFAHRKAVPGACPECSAPTLDAQRRGYVYAEPDGMHPDGRWLKCSACGGTGHTHTSGIFSAFRPTAIEYVVKDDDPPEKLQRLADRGIRLVRVQRAGEPTGNLMEGEAR